MSTSVDIVLRLDKKNKREEAPLYLRFTKNRKVNYLATGHKLLEKFWDNEKRKVKSSYPNSVRLNNYLNNLRFKYQDEVLKVETTNTKVSSKQLKKKITGNNETDFFIVAQDVLRKYESDEKTRTLNKGRSILQKIKSYLRKDKLPLEDISVEWLGKYEAYLKGKLKNKINTINKDLRFIRRVYNEAVRLDLIGLETSPFLRYSLKTEKTNKVYLTDAEIASIENLELVPGSRMALHRDMFIFASYAGGLRVSDTLMLKWKDFDGSHINVSIQKTRSQLSIKLPDKANGILKRYQPLEKDIFIFPILKPGKEKHIPTLNTAISNATAYINKDLKVIAQKAGIEKNISFHTARHSWATRALRKGISIDKVSKIMGHAAIKETQIYAKIVNEELDKAMDAFN